MRVSYIVWFEGVHFDQYASDFDERSWKTLDIWQSREWNTIFITKRVHISFFDQWSMQWNVCPTKMITLNENVFQRAFKYFFQKYPRDYWQFTSFVFSPESKSNLEAFSKTAAAFIAGQSHWRKSISSLLTWVRRGFTKFVELKFQWRKAKVKFVFHSLENFKSREAGIQQKMKCAKWPNLSELHNFELVQLVG